MPQKTEKQTPQQVSCTCCGRRAPKETMVMREGKYYCCEDCADGKECECGE